MKYSDYISIREGFQTSVNLEFDLTDIEKIKSYIPTNQSVEILGRFLKSFYYGNNAQSRATVLVGPYGRGKSHLLLVLTALTSLDMISGVENKDAAKQVLQDLCAKVQKVNAEVGALANAVFESNIRTLPVLINSNTNDMTQAFLVALNSALRNAGLSRLLPSTYFDSAIEVIDKWTADYPDALTKLSGALKTEKQTIESLYIGLKQFDVSAYELFCKCYPQVAAGTSFNPLSNADVVKLYISVTHALVTETDYSGINIVFDEFSKYLEANLDKSNMLNFKIIQDMAEAAARSKEEQIHLTCITHKEILDYSTSDSFRAVEGRFDTIRFVSSSEQSYELIANAIQRSPSYDLFKNNYSEVFQALVEEPAPAVFDGFPNSVYENVVVLGCFPLAPLSSYSLLNISSLVGQNERSLFTFLSQDAPHTFTAFLKTERETTDLLSIDYIYDYFEPVFQKEIFNPKVHSMWAKSDSALRQISDVNEAKIVKAIAIINIINDEQLRPISAHIKNALQMVDEVFASAIKNLQRNHVLTLRPNSEYVFLTANGVDIQKNIENYLNTKVLKYSLGNVVTSACAWSPVIPREHNDKCCTFRYFKSVFMEGEVFLRYTDARQIIDTIGSDGVIVYLLESEEFDSQDRIAEHISSFKGYPQVVVCRSKKPFSKNELVKKIVAAQQLKESPISREDSHYFDEVVVYEEDLTKQLKEYVFSLYAPSSADSFYMNCDGEISITRQAELGQKVSKICDDLYHLTPIVNNEMVNKNTLNAQNLKGRNLVVKWLLSHANDMLIPCMEGYGPEVSVFKSVFCFTGLDRERIVNDQGMNSALAVIRNFIISCEGNRTQLSGLYSILSSPPYGMRKGVIPLLVAYVLREYRDNAVFYYKSKEVELSDSVLSSMNDSPESYYLLLDKGTEAKEQFLDAIEDLFSDYKDTRGTSINKLYSVVKCMQSWMRSLPGYTKRFSEYLQNGNPKTISDQTKRIRSDLLKFEVNAREMLFDGWLEKTGNPPSYALCFRQIADTKDELDLHLNSFRSELCGLLIELFYPGYHGSLSQAISNWYKELPVETKHHVFDADPKAILNVAESLRTYDDEAVLDELVMEIASIAIEDWNDDIFHSFVSQMTESIQKINQYDGGQKTEKTSEIAINISGKLVNRSFSAEDISPLGNTVLKNLEAVFDEYNDAVSPDEKLAIIAKLIEGVVS